MLRILLAFGLFAAVIGAAPAKPAAKPAAPTLKDFFGEWRGHAVAMSETDEDFSTTKRDLAVSVKPNELGGFVLSWSTLQRQKGDPRAPTEVMKATTVELIPTAEPNKWQAKTQADVYAGGMIVWARLEANTLIVSTFTIGRDGRPELQTYRRQVSGRDMKLEFSNVRDGEVQRVVSGNLKKQ
jgi:hypothetical protein